MAVVCILRDDRDCGGLWLSCDGLIYFLLYTSLSHVSLSERLPLALPFIAPEAQAHVFVKHRLKNCLCQMLLRKKWIISHRLETFNATSLTLMVFPVSRSCLYACCIKRQSKQC